jgi:hypothetical protein
MNKRNAILILTFLAMFSCGKESSENRITAFSIASVAGTIDETRKTIAVELPYGTDITALVPIIQTSGKTKITPATSKPQNFTQPVVYTVVAENGSTAVYTVTVTIAPNTEARVITFSFEGLPAEVAGVIDEATHTITVAVLVRMLPICSPALCCRGKPAYRLPAMQCRILAMRWNTPLRRAMGVSMPIMLLWLGIDLRYVMN